MKSKKNKIIERKQSLIAKDEKKVAVLQEKIAVLKSQLAEKQQEVDEAQKQAANPVVEVKVVNSTSAKKKNTKISVLKSKESKTVKVDIVGLIKKEQKFNVKAWLIASTFAICSCLLGIANLVLKFVK